MTRRLLLCRTVLSLLLLGIPFTENSAEDPDEFDFPDLIIEPAEVLKNSETPDGTFLWSREDFIYCGGKNFLAPPPSTPLFADQKSIGEWNNGVLGTLFKKEGSAEALKEGERRFAEGLSRNPQFFSFVYNYARILSLEHRHSEAIEFYRRASRLLPEFSGSYRRLGDSYARIGRDREAINSYRAAITKNPYRIDALLALARYFIEKDSLRHAMQYIEEAGRRMPEHPDLIFTYALWYEKKGDPIKARKFYERIQTAGTIEEKVHYDFSFLYRRAAFYEALGEIELALEDYESLMEFRALFFLKSIREESVKRRIRLLEKKLNPSPIP